MIITKIERGVTEDTNEPCIRFTGTISICTYKQCFCLTDKTLYYQTLGELVIDDICTLLNSIDPS